MPKAAARAPARKITDARVLCAASIGLAFAALALPGPPARALPTPPVREEAPARPCEAAPTLAQARPMITSYYATEGEWAGEYAIRELVRARFVRPRRDALEAHVRYRYECVRDRCRGTLDEGFDQRVFYFQCRAGGWRVVRMGGHMSAELP